jgi:hypothetical protein
MEDLIKQLKVCSQCKELEKLLATYEDGKVMAIAYCPNNHYARILKAPAALRAALG